MAKKTTERKKKPVVSDKVYNIHHPEYTGLIEEAFVANGEKFYCFSKDSGMRYGRYIFMQGFIQEADLRMSLDVLKKQNEVMTSWLDGTRPQVNHGKVLELLSIQRQQCDLAFEPETVFRLASCLYFDENEDLRKWDKTYNEKKITKWKESHTIDFFFHRLMQEFVNLKDTSPIVLQNYLQAVPETLKGWKLMSDILSR
jgi:hypothetical protein